jgi:hypothetical protein
MFIEADQIWIMQKSIEADILIMAKSCFSYVAALLSDGIKIYEEWHFPPLSSWVIRGANGKFDSEAFERQLVHYVQRGKSGESTGHQYDRVLLL